MFTPIIMATQFPVSYSADATMYNNPPPSGGQAGTYYLQTGPTTAGAVIPSNLEVAGNLTVLGNTHLVGAVTTDSTLAVAGTISSPAAIISTTGFESGTPGAPAAALFPQGFSSAGAGSVTGNLACGANITMSNLAAIATLGVTSIPSLTQGSLAANVPGATGPGSFNPDSNRCYGASMVIAGWRVAWGSTPLSGTGAGGGGYCNIVFNGAGTNVDVPGGGTFPATPFSARPMVVAQVADGASNTMVSITSRTDLSGFSCNLFNIDGVGAGSQHAYWLAIGPA